MGRKIWPTYFGLFALATYLVWNVAWLISGNVPKSMLTGLTGIPCPTTGGTRSFIALASGNFQRSLYFNPMTIPIIGLFGITLGQWLRRGKAANWIPIAWIVVLAVAWFAKVMSPIETW